MKRAERNKLDREFSLLIRERGLCEWCGRKPPAVQLQCAHIYSRRHMKIRHNPMNALSLCAGCHWKAHQNPIEFALFVQGYLGPNKLDELRRLKNLI